MAKQTEINETDLLARISRERLMETNAAVAQWVRLSGSPEERAAFQYVQAQLESYGLQTTWLEHPAFISLPQDASLELIDNSGKPIVSFNCLTHSFSASVDSLEAQVVDLAFGNAADYSGKDVRGKLVLQNGLASPTAVFRAERAGAVGQVFVNDDHLHNMIVTSIWGTPTPESADRIPKIPVVSVVQADGENIRQRITQSKTRARVRTRVFRGWKTTPIVVGDLTGPATTDFVMLSGHLDSWDYGAMDNGSANATMLEVARVIAQAKDALRRGLRVIFWSGHSHGRYSGSTWYADHYWEELFDRCVAHINVDSTGARGATFYGSFQSHSELATLGATIIKEQTGQDTRAFRMSRAGDMSFNGVGIPALFMEMSQVPLTDANTNNVTLSYGTEMGGTMPWWWHTSEDTIDKVDPAVLELDTRVYLSTVWRLTALPVLPMDFRPVVAEISKELADLQQAADGHLDFGIARERIALLTEQVEKLSNRALLVQTPDQATVVNRDIKMLSRVLVPMTYTLAGRFDHDPAWSEPFLPSLQAAKRLRQIVPNSDEYQFLKTRLVRNLNAFCFALREALELLAD